MTSSSSRRHLVADEIDPSTREPAASGRDLRRRHRRCRPNLPPLTDRQPPSSTSGRVDDLDDVTNSFRSSRSIDFCDRRRPNVECRKSDSSPCRRMSDRHHVASYGDVIDAGQTTDRDQRRRFALSLGPPSTYPRYRTWPLNNVSSVNRHHPMPTWRHYYGGGLVSSSSQLPFSPHGGVASLRRRCRHRAPKTDFRLPPLMPPPSSSSATTVADVIEKTEQLTSTADDDDEEDNDENEVYGKSTGSGNDPARATTVSDGDNLAGISLPSNKSQEVAAGVGLRQGRGASMTVVGRTTTVSGTTLWTIYERPASSQEVSSSVAVAAPDGGQQQQQKLVPRGRSGFYRARLMAMVGREKSFQISAVGYDSRYADVARDGPPSRLRRDDDDDGRSPEVTSSRLVERVVAVDDKCRQWLQLHDDEDDDNDDFRRQLPRRSRRRAKVSLGDAKNDVEPMREKKRQQQYKQRLVPIGFDWTRCQGRGSFR